MATTSFTTPEWVHNAIFYQIFPDRFASDPRVPKPAHLQAWDTAPTPTGFKGGDLGGIANQLDYLKDLGITALYLTPIFQSASNHRYHTHDYYRVDPLLGGDPAFHHLLKEAHRRSIRVVLDGVFNHASRGFFQFNHILEVGKDSPYVDWFHINGYPLNAYQGKPNYGCWVDLPALPQFNHANHEVQKYIFDVARYWLDQGIDGWRLDVPFEVKEPDFWANFREEVKSVNPNAYITGEIPWDASPWLKGDQFDGVMNYLFAYSCWGFFGGKSLNRDLVGHWYTHGPEYFVTEAGAFASCLESLLKKYPQPAVLAQLNLLDSHDCSRFLSMVNEDKRMLRLATLVQMTYPGAPCIYYGNEIGLSGGQDPDNRRAFPWDQSKWDNDLLQYFQKLTRTRNANEVLRTGDFNVLLAKNGVVVYSRKKGNDTAITVINHSASTYHLDVDLPDRLLEDGHIYRDQLSYGQAQVVNGKLQGLTVAPESGALLL